MKFFKFELKRWYFDDKFINKCIVETHYLNVESIKDIIVPSGNDKNYFNVVLHGGCELNIEYRYLSSLLDIIGQR